jgi:uncharacterized protein YjbI with pentapeptide repeats
LRKRVWAIAISLTAVGFGLWIWALVITNDTAGRLSELGSALLSGAVVAFAVFFLEREFDARAERQNREFQERADRQNREFQERADNQAMRLMVNLQRDLRDVDLSRLDLTRAVLNGRDLRGAIFIETNLVSAALLRANLGGARFYRADLTDAKFSYADLDGAEFTDSDLTDALFTGAVHVARADFAYAWYHRGKPPTFDGAMPSGGARRPPRGRRLTRCAPPHRTPG